ncbi:hypothetical protein [Novosphingobium sp. KN65.2]|uniref:hypothetical protein n=1 Tax=Novosphingobium sp. KN65.2 TaxID=1478134 RepID=UPI0012E103B9|nr:hypothetical protein [Novosphingobium sp. KN65.2]
MLEADIDHGTANRHDYALAALGSIRYCHRRSPPRLVMAPLGEGPEGRCRDRLGTG